MQKGSSAVAEDLADKKLAEKRHSWSDGIIMYINLIEYVMLRGRGGNDKSKINGRNPPPPGGVCHYVYGPHAGKISL